MKVRYTRKALAEIGGIFEYIARDNPKAADDVAAAMIAPWHGSANTRMPRLLSLATRFARSWSVAINIGSSIPSKTPS
jgi:plasmid stabilization system protein ParE